MLKAPTLVLTAAAIAVASLALAQGRGNPAVDARKAQMHLQLFYAGALGAMARGKVPYDAAAAKTAADNLVLITSIDYASYFPEGTDNATIDDTHALPAIWQDMPGFLGHFDTLHSATTQLAATAGDGLDALKANIGGAFKACGGCHETYRAPLK